MTEITEQTTYCGTVALVGRPNVGKSTLLNQMIGQKLCITSHKPQTTRHQIMGVRTEDNLQTIYVDTPGLHKNEKKAINRYMNRAAHNALTGVDVAVFVVDVRRWTEEDELVVTKLQQRNIPVILVINKVDLIKNKEELLPKLQQLSIAMSFAEVIPVSAYKGDNLKALEEAIDKLLPEGPFLFDEDQITDRSQRFLAAEIVREKLMRSLGEEVPYEITVEIDLFNVQDNGCLDISAVILVERPAQKKIVIGKKGERLKEIGSQARIDMKNLFATPVHLQLWVKVKSGWSDDERALHSLGYDE
ncbi:GTP-binding protein Era (plasmid) [Piscirickettsia salmonis]|uniref:GTPase Era n=1 Tax=Piscirickettsia salmonis TaxID=1238 RepID=A0A6I5Y3R2_PISSA|nr:GTPase Era [Piscirickettsia salmonis]ALB23134.1 GTPase Era [Piscirickettsia salmonis]ALY03065.1 GTPase Era [Piscirickettsia salmonis]AMA42623.1 GTPase Era [Piscirickettsia salmonis]AOS35093.1 GTPase Era [Piscirickettsia salmonis]APS59801.1 GTPase Era [Piscirickettsia salmonis]